MRISGNFNIFNSETIGTYEDQVLDAEIVSWFARINASFPLPFGITTQLRTFYRGPSATHKQNLKDLSMSGAINKDLFNKKGTCLSALQISLTLEKKGDTKRKL